MEKKIVYLKLFQIVLTLAFIWQLISLGQFCGTFANPKAFFCDLSARHCDRYTLIGRDAETGEFGSMYNKLHNQFFMNRTNTTDELKCQFIHFLTAKLPPAGRQCIPITISPFDCLVEWIGKGTNPLDNDTLIYFSVQLFVAMCLLIILVEVIIIMQQQHSVKAYKFAVYLGAFGSVIGWCFCAAISSNLLLDWTDFWSCVNFQADHTNVPLVTLMLSLVLACSSIFEIVLHKFVLNDDVDTECANVSIDQQHQKKNGCAFV